MKKLYILFLATLMTCGVAGAQTVKVITSEEDALMYGGQQIFAISNNGRYAAGSTMTLNPFIYDSQENRTIVFTDALGSSSSVSGGELHFVSDDGVAVGWDDNGGIRCTATGGYTVIESAKGTVNMAMCESMTQDGSVIVGSVADGGWNQNPCYWKNGERVMLDFPTTDEAGFKINGARALAISADGKVIMGQIIDRYQSLPLILWELQADGTYAVNNAWKGKYESFDEPVYDENGKQIDAIRGENPYLIFRPGAMSSDGKSVALYIVENTEELNPPFIMGIYDVPSGEMELVPDMATGMMRNYGEFIIRGIADNRTVFGTAGALALGTEPFIVFPDQLTPLPLEEAYPDVDQFQLYYDNKLEGMPYLGTAISADARFLGGYTIILTDNNMFAEGFIFDTGAQNNAVEKVESAGLEREEYLTIDGLRLNAPQKGLNIIRTKDGNVKKVIIK